jgi:hypothetical protein
MGASSQGLKTPFTFEGQKDNVLKFEVLCEQLCVCSPAYLVVVTSELQLGCN